MKTGRKPNLLNVKKHLQWVEESIQDMLSAHEKGQRETKAGRIWTGIVLPPSYEMNLKEISLLTRAILKKHASTGVRKDIYVEKKES